MGPTKTITYESQQGAEKLAAFLGERYGKNAFAMILDEGGAHALCACTHVLSRGPIDSYSL